MDFITDPRSNLTTSIYTPHGKKLLKSYLIQYLVHKTKVGGGNSMKLASSKFANPVTKKVPSGVANAPELLKTQYHVLPVTFSKLSKSKQLQELKDIDDILQNSVNLKDTSDELVSSFETVFETLTGNKPDFLQQVWKTSQCDNNWATKMLQVCCARV